MSSIVNKDSGGDSYGSNNPPSAVVSSQQQHPSRPPSAQSGHSSHSSSSSYSKHVRCIGRYVLTSNTLGKGNFARVEAAIHTLTRSKVAIKIIETDKIKEEYVKKNLLREAQLMRRLRHPNIIRLYETMKTNNLYCLVTEVAEGGELLSYVRNDFKERRLPEATTRPFIRQLTSALYYLHSNGVVHRDLKMENILLDKKKRQVKIVDFGLSNSQKPGALLQTHCGSPEYAAPELFIPGRQYGPEVDVWSLGVNMYAMLVGKLPFRSPRQGGKKRQKLLEQISAGITEYHEKEMQHLSTGAQDLIGQLLQPDSTHRVLLEEAMHHPWVTKDGTQPLKPYEQCNPDPMTTTAVMDLMQKVLGESHSQIKETVRRDRCDWLAAVFNLLMDQPEGRTILQRMLSGDPADYLTSAADDYQSAIAEHLSLSQSFSQGQQNSQESEQQDLTGILTKPSFMSNRHNNNHESSSIKRLSHTPMMSSHGNLHNEHSTDYPTSTLSSTKTDKKRHMIEESHAHRMYTMHPASASHGQYGSRNHRYSVDLSPKHNSSLYDSKQNKMAGPHYDDYRPSFGMTTPTPLTVKETRPHSRLSAPDPIPVPFQKSIYFKSGSNSHHHHQPTPRTHDSPLILSPSHTPSPTNHQPDIIPEDNVGYHGNKRRPSSKTSSGRRSQSGSTDTTLDGAIHGSVPWKGKVQVAPYRRSSVDSTPPIGWSSQTQFGSTAGVSGGTQKGVNKPSPADIQSLMPQEGSHRLMDSIMRSSNSTEIKPEMFAHTTERDRLVMHKEHGRMPNEVVTGDMSLKRSHRSSSARQPYSRHQSFTNSEMTSSVKHFGELEPLGPINGFKYPSSVQSHDGHKGDMPLPNIIDTLPNKDSPNSKRRSFSGIIGKAFSKKSSSGNKMERTNLVETTENLSDM